MIIKKKFAVSLLVIFALTTCIFLGHNDEAIARDVNGDAYITTTDATLITPRAGGNTTTAFSIEAKF